MACMYWMVRTNIISVSPLAYNPYDHIATDSGAIITWEVIVSAVTGDVSTGAMISGAIVTWSLLSWQQSGNVVGTGIDETVAIMQQSWSTSTGDETPSVPSSVSTLSHTKEYACAQPTGIYTNPLRVWWNNVLTASTRGYIKVGSFLHYVVNVSNGTRYYYYHNCVTGVAKNAQNLTNTKLTRVVLSAWKVYLR
jgi:hypothetical protein